MGDRSTYLRVAAVGLQLAVAAACLVIGWRVMHGTPGRPAVRVQGSRPAPFAGAAPVLVPVKGADVKPTPSPGVGAPTLADLLARVNRDDALQYRGQWQAVRMLGSATRDYLERRVVPMLLAAARGAAR